MYCRYKSFKKQYGMVVVVALFIMTLVAVMAITMMTRLERDTRRTTLLLNNIQAEFYAQGSIAWAIDQLRNDWQNKKPDRLIDNIPMHSPVNEVNHYQISSTIYDMQARYNLNNLINIDAQKDFLRLIKYVNPKMTSAELETISRAILDWLTPGNKTNTYEQYYTNLSAPYRAAHRAFLSVDELRLVKGITPELFNALKSHIVALPRVTPINIQTAQPAVLLTLSSSMTLNTARQIVEMQQQKPFLTISQFTALPAIKNQQIDAKKIDAISQFFLIETKIDLTDQHLVLYTLAERITDKGPTKIVIHWQSKGSW